MQDAYLNDDNDVHRFKQLKHKCNELEKQNKMLSQNNSVQQWCDMYNQKDKECFNALLKLGRTEQVLNEIEKHIKNVICDEECSFTWEKPCPDCDCRYNNIIEKINKAKDSE